MPFPVVLFNGPPGSGKDTAAKAVCRLFHGVRHLKFAGAVKDATHALFGLDCATDAFEKTKGIPSPEFGGLTPRQAYIDFSERAVKPVFGENRFGLSAARRVAGARDAGAQAAVFSDCGFAQEIGPVADLVGRENMLLVRIHAEGRGCTFAGDSRSHITIPGVETIDLTNDGQEAAFVRAVVANVEEWIGVVFGRVTA